MGTNQARAVVLRSRPRGAPKASDFELISRAQPEPGPDEFVVRVLLCSLDPAMRRWMDADSYATSIPIGGEIPCTLIGRVTRSRCTAFPGDSLVTGRGTIASHCLMGADSWTRGLDDRDPLPLAAHLSVLGTSGLTAFNGLLKVGRPRPGDTVLVSAAAGSVGSLVGQIARIQGCRTVGIAGGPAKCELLTSTFGYDAAVDYRGRDADTLAAAVRAACPTGVDVYFDNVGGACLEAALAAINRQARIVLCGMIGEYNQEQPPAGPRNLWQLIARAATMTGFLNREYLDDCSAELRQLRSWINEGRLAWPVHEEPGLDGFHRAFMRLFDGSNAGKLLLRVADA